jgi:hypothetical protein
MVQQCVCVSFVLVSFCSYLGISGIYSVHRSSFDVLCYTGSLDMHRSEAMFTSQSTTHSRTPVQVVCIKVLRLCKSRPQVFQTSCTMSPRVPCTCGCGLQVTYATKLNHLNGRGTTSLRAGVLETTKLLRSAGQPTTQQSQQRKSNKQSASDSGQNVLPNGNSSWS